MSLFRFTRDPSPSRNIFSLNGPWLIVPGTESEPSKQFAREIAVPSVVDCAVPALTGREADFYWYNCEFNLDGILPPQRLWLKIEQAQFGTAVWVDGSLAGSSIACYTSQEYRIDHLLKGRSRHTISIRVGARETLPPESAVGRDIEKKDFTPGIWGDVSLICTLTPRIKHIQIIPSLKNSKARVRVTLDGIAENVGEVLVRTTIVEWRLAKPFTDGSTLTSGRDGDETVVECEISMNGCRAWSPDDPFLYEARVAVETGGVRTDESSVRFGMRDFEIVGNEFHLNGERIFLKGGNIAFHRFLGDDERKLLPWDMNWVKRALIDIPKAHHFNFFRFHLGHAYNRWYDLADEHGIVLQEEWQFWNATGANAVIETEFRQWILDNANHPSIVMWDPLNESTDDSLIHDVVPQMRELDPSRPWESVDVHEQHPYIYSLGMTLNQRRLGYATALPALERSSEPVIVNEFLWWWFDREWHPTVLMKDVIERWLGRNATNEQIIDRQQYLGEELVGLFRRMRCGAIQPFVYLSNNRGPTAHWFEGPITELRPKPLLAALKNAYAPFGVSIDLWDRHFCAGDEISFPVHVFNDEAKEVRGRLEVAIRSERGEVTTKFEQPVAVLPTDRQIVSERLTLPTRAGRYEIRASLMHATSEQPATSSRTIVVAESDPTVAAHRRPLVLIDPMQEVERFLRSRNIGFARLGDGSLQPGQMLFVNTFGLEYKAYRDCIAEVTRFLDAGGIVIVQEPEFRTVEPKTLDISSSHSMRIERRLDVDKGGYDSYVFPEEESHPLWHGIRPEHLQWFNGAPGGEIVSEYTITPSMEFVPLASCGLGLRIPAVMSIAHGKGKVIVSRIQVRGRLDRQRKSPDRFARRFDPVAAQYLLNLISL